MHVLPPAPSGPVAQAYAPSGPVAQAYAPSGPVAQAYAPSGPVAQAYAPSGPVAQAYAPMASPEQLRGVSPYAVVRNPFDEPPPRLAPVDAARSPAAVAARRAPTTVMARTSLDALVGSRRNVLLIGGTAAAVAIVLIAVALGRGGSAEPEVAAVSAPAVSAGPGARPAIRDTAPIAAAPVVPGQAVAAAPSVAAPSAAEPSATAPSVAEPSATEPSATEPSATEPSAAEPPAPVVVAPAAPRVAAIGGKQVVLEYDAQTRDGSKVAPGARKADASAILKARAAYAAGNQKLFAGDAPAAIRQYQQSLAAYPGYVAAYRGLGLAHAKQGNKPQAVKAFRTYLGAVPRAKDAALIRKRMTGLQAR